MPKIYRSGEELSPKEIASHANVVHQIVGGKGSPFTEDMYTPNDTNYRLSGNHCDCGCDENAVGKPSLGEFELFSFRSEEVRHGGKAYMICRKCGCYSHL